MLEAGLKVTTMGRASKRIPCFSCSLAGSLEGAQHHCHIGGNMRVLLICTSTSAVPYRPPGEDHRFGASR